MLSVTEMNVIVTDPPEIIIDWFWFEITWQKTHSLSNLQAFVLLDNTSFRA